MSCAQPCEVLLYLVFIWLALPSAQLWSQQEIRTTKRSYHFFCFHEELKTNNKINIKIEIEGVAQLAAAADSRSAGWGFESLRPQSQLFYSISFFSLFSLTQENTTHKHQKPSTSSDTIQVSVQPISESESEKSCFQGTTEVALPCVLYS